MEVPNSEGGVLEVFIDDALQPSATTDGGFAGMGNSSNFCQVLVLQFACNWLATI